MAGSHHRCDRMCEKDRMCSNEADDSQAPADVRVGRLAGRSALPWPTTNGPE
jgi:hypothetical protein